MTSENKIILKKRFKSFIWRLGAYIIVAFLAFIVDNIGLFGLPAAVVAIIALVIGEITKYLNVDLTKLKTID